MKGECTFVLFKFLIIGFYSSSANYLLEIFSFLTIPPEAFLSKNVIPMK